MDRNEAKKLWPIIKAYSNGKVVQKYITDASNEKRWVDIDTLVVSEMVYEMSKYRIKPKPTYRPFANADECWGEMKKHEPFGWVTFDGSKEYIVRLTEEAIKLYTTSYYDYKQASVKFEFADGTPFGKLTEE